MKILLDHSVGLFLHDLVLAWLFMCEWSSILLTGHFLDVHIALEASDNVRKRPCQVHQWLHKSLQDRVWKLTGFSSKTCRLLKMATFHLHHQCTLLVQIGFQNETGEGRVILQLFWPYVME